jgi:hypothetical protein
MTLDDTGHASYATSTLTVGKHIITATYSGDAKYSASTASLTETITGPPLATATSLTATPNPSSFGESVTFTARVKAASGPIPSGTVTFTRGATPIGTVALNASGLATVATTALPLGNHTITAIYSGSTSDQGSSCDLAVTIDKSTTETALAFTPNPTSFGQTVTFTATVTAASGPVPNGTVVFVRGATLIGSAALNDSGIATVSTSTLPPKDHTITAIYDGDAHDLGSSAAVRLTINPAATAKAAVVASAPAITAAGAVAMR